jgi:MFS family permease
MHKPWTRNSSTAPQFPLFLVSLGLSNFGDTLRAVAIIVFLFKLTGSGLSSSLGIVYSLLPGILLSPFAGILGDRFPEKYVLIAVELARGLVITIFISTISVSLIYLMLIILASLDVLGSPSSKKLTVNILGKNGVVRGNSYLSGVAGITNILGSLLSGVFTALWGIQVLFLINSALHGISALLLLFINTGKQVPERRTLKKGFSGLSGLKISFGVSNSPNVLRSVIAAFTVMSFTGIPNIIAFYPYSFDILKVTEKGWGLIMAFFYTTNIIAMLLAVSLRKKLSRLSMTPIYLLMIAASAVWFAYSTLETFLPVLLLQLAEGTALSMCSIFLISKLQIVTKSDYMARVAGMNDFINNLGRIAGTGYAYLIIYLSSVKFLFTINSLMLFSYALLHLIFQSNDPRRISAVE